jgi:hypothetical protein
MKMEDVNDWMKRSEMHVRNPQAGDYFTDHMCPVVIVDKRANDDVKVRKIHIVDGERRWKEPEWMTLADFVAWLSYGSIPGVWVEHHSPKQSASTVPGEPK